METTRGKIDLWLLGAVILLLALSLIMVSSSSAVMADKYWHDSYFFARKQAIFCFLGLLLIVVCIRLDYTFFARFPYLWVGGAFLLLALTAWTPLGILIRGSRRWLNLGVISIQPLEVAKLALIFYLSDFFGRKQELVKTFSIGFLPPLLMTGLLCSLLLTQPDFGGAVYLVLVLFFLSYVGGARTVYLFTLGILGLVGAVMLVASSPYRFKRWFAFLDPFKDYYDTGYQLVQSLYALGSGSWLGSGLGASKQKLLFLPDAHNDFILAVLGEELGFMGISLVFALIAILIWRTFYIAINVTKLEQKLLALGMGMLLFVGGLLNGAVVFGAVPPKGIPMPFLSYGGSQLLVCCFASGILLSLSKEVEVPCKE